MPYKQPPEDKQFKKGQSGNPKGRPKGIPNRSIIARMVLEMKGTPPEEVLRSLQSMYPKFFEKKGKKWQNEFLAYVRMMQAAIIKADVKAFELILDSAYGKAKKEISIDSKPIEEISKTLKDFLEK